MVSGYEGVIAIALEAQHRASVASQTTRGSMNSTPPRIDRSGRPDAPPISTDATQQVAAPFTEAANDDEFDGNPLWLVAGAMGLLFGLLACFVVAS
jgi:hypothetical protein